MATQAKKKTASAKKPPAQPELVFEDGYWWIVKGTTRLNVGRSKAYAERYLADLK